MVDFLRQLKKEMSAIYFIIIFTVLTFYMHNGYYDTLEAKGSMLFYTTLFYTVTMVSAYMLLFVLEEKREWQFWKKLHAVDWGLLIFSALAFVSTIFSDDKKTAFWGGDGCRIGSLIIFLLSLSCIFLSKNMQLDRPLLCVILLSGCVVFLWGIADCFDLDFMNWKANMISNPYDYLATIGNRDWYVGYLALLLPFIAVLFLYEQNKEIRLFCTACLFLGFINLYITKNDGNLLVFGCAIPIVYDSLKEEKRWKRFVQMLWIFVLASFAVKGLCVFVEPSHVTGISMLGALENAHWYLALVVITFFLQISEEKVSSLHLEKAWLGFSVFVIAALFIVVVFCFDGSFGSDRGYIWTYAVKTFKESGFWQKLAGWGPDCFKNAVYSMAGNDIVATWPENNVIANAHNEVLQYLVTMGIAGMISYLTVFVSAFVCAVKKKSVLCIAAGTSLFSYFCTALGNNPQPLNYGIMFIVFAMLNMKCSFLEDVKQNEMQAVVLPHE